MQAARAWPLGVSGGLLQGSPGAKVPSVLVEDWPPSRGSLNEDPCMLDDVGEVNWTEFFRDDPYPPDLPRLLRELTSLDANQREGVTYGMSEIFGAHPEVIPFVVPFLLELMQATAGDVKESVLQLLLTSAGGLVPPEPDCDYVYTVEGQPELAETIRTALNRGSHLYRESLTDLDPEVRALAACVVAVTRDVGSLDILRDRLQRESHPQAYVRMLGALSRFAPQEALPIAERDLASEIPLVKLHAGAIIGELTKPTIPREALDALVGLAMEYWATDWVRMNALITLSRFGHDALSYALDKWIDRLLDPPGSLADLVWFLLRAVFRSRAPFPTAVSPSEITPNQLKVLHALAGNLAVWQLPRTPRGHFKIREVYNDLIDSGLPSTRGELIEFLRQASEHNTP